MRNEWFPKNKAEYMTPTRFQELGLTRDAIGEVDRSFVILSALDAALKPEEQEVEEPVPEVQIPKAKVPDVTVRTLPFPWHPACLWYNGERLVLTKCKPQTARNCTRPAIRARP